jgi:hypothetical protein
MHVRLRQRISARISLAIPFFQVAILATSGKHVVTKTTNLQFIETHLAARAAEIGALLVYERPDRNTRNDAREEAKLAKARRFDR